MIENPPPAQWIEPSKADYRAEQDASLTIAVSAIAWLVFFGLVLTFPALLWMIWTAAW